MNSPSLVVVGSINLDQSLRVTRHPRPGETLPGDGLAYSPGGKGANQAVAAALLGAPVVMVGAVGQDANADLALVHLREAGVDLSHVRGTTQPTGLAVIAVDEQAENTIIVASGANALVDAEMVQGAGDVIQCAAVVIAQGEIPVGGTRRAAELCRGRFILNLAPAITMPAEVIRRADPLVVNEHEGADALRIIAPQHEAGSDETVAEGLVAAGVPSVVITRGSAGALVVDSDGSLTEVPPCRITPVDTTGAGDAFVGALASRLLQGDTLVDAAGYGSQVAAYACTGAGAQASYPSLDDELPTPPEL